MITTRAKVDDYASEPGGRLLLRVVPIHIIGQLYAAIVRTWHHYS